MIILLLGRSKFGSRLRRASDDRQLHSNAPTVTAALSDDPDPADFKGGYQTVVAIIQGVAFVVLTSTTFREIRTSISQDHLAHSVGIGIQALVTLSVIVIVTFEYFDLTGAAAWSLGFFDIIIPYMLGIGEVAQATWLGDNALWWGSLSFLLLASTVAFKYSAHRARPESFRDIRYYGYFKKTIDRLALASLITFAFATAVCVASIYENLPPWLFATAPLVATLSFVGIWLLP